MCWHIDLVQTSSCLEQHAPRPLSQNSSVSVSLNNRFPRLPPEARRAHAPARAPLRRKRARAPRRRRSRRRHCSAGVRLRRRPAGGPTTSGRGCARLHARRPVAAAGGRFSGAAALARVCIAAGVGCARRTAGAGRPQAPSGRQAVAARAGCSAVAARDGRLHVAAGGRRAVHLARGGARAQGGGARLSLPVQARDDHQVRERLGPPVAHPSQPLSPSSGPAHRCARTAANF